MTLLTNSPIVTLQVPLITYLLEASARIGGETLRRRQLNVFFWNGNVSEETVEEVPSLGGTSQLSVALQGFGTWRAATIRSYDSATGRFELKYHDEPKRSQAHAWLPFALLHFARNPPSSLAAIRNIADLPGGASPPADAATWPEEQPSLSPPSAERQQPEKDRRGPYWEPDLSDAPVPPLLQRDSLRSIADSNSHRLGEVSDGGSPRLSRLGASSALDGPPHAVAPAASFGLRTMLLPPPSHMNRQQLEPLSPVGRVFSASATAAAAAAGAMPMGSSAEAEVATRAAAAAHPFASARAGSGMLYLRTGSSGHLHISCTSDCSSSQSGYAPTLPGAGDWSMHAFPDGGAASGGCGVSPSAECFQLGRNGGLGPPLSPGFCATAGWAAGPQEPYAPEQVSWDSSTATESGHGGSGGSPPPPPLAYERSNSDLGRRAAAPFTSFSRASFPHLPAAAAASEAHHGGSIGGGAADEATAWRAMYSEVYEADGATCQWFLTKQGSGAPGAPTAMQAYTPYSVNQQQPSWHAPTHGAYGSGGGDVQPSPFQSAMQGRAAFMSLTTRREQQQQRMQVLSAPAASQASAPAAFLPISVLGQKRAVPDVGGACALTRGSVRLPPVTAPADLAADQAEAAALAVLLMDWADHMMCEDMAVDGDPWSVPPLPKRCHAAGPSKAYSSGGGH
ncbi:hypothetical protein GPECTOR_67g305 [Gonium pectorale]|uniref:Uncharacterized protein n=1 Tax=Gonium pectorale TaxID=33097 RepID=A0A150G4L0_GONPE|nr:hypothetical protein GPECTOR_67g305 [Gonium pectorale]|eukprot:KXZ44465.1 hypothetical protein GPECTOR_67g305 [Gonium pectorale]